MAFEDVAMSKEELEKIAKETSFNIHISKSMR